MKSAILLLALTWVYLIEAQSPLQPCNEKIPDSAQCGMDPESCTKEGMLPYCQRYCGLCDASNEELRLTLLTNKICADRNSLLCSLRKSSCAYDEKVRESCPETCNLCSSGPTQGKCSDLNPKLCPMRIADCQDEEVKQSCRYTCGACEQTTETSVKTSTTPVPTTTTTTPVPTTTTTTPVPTTTTTTPVPTTTTTTPVPTTTTTTPVPTTTATKTSTTPVPSQPVACVDQQPKLCPVIKADCEHEEVQATCQLTCGVCARPNDPKSRLIGRPSSVVYSPLESCRDWNVLCPGARSECTTNQFVQTLCPGTCGVC